MKLGGDPHGTRVIQNLIKYLSNDHLIDKFISIIKPHTITLINKLNGTHVIQKLCNDFPEKSKFIYDDILNNCENIASHKHGCCVLQRYLINKNNEFTIKLTNKILDNFNSISIDQFGNYIIQSIIKLNDDNINKLILNKMINNIVYYSKHKFSSNIVEKFFEFCNDDIKQVLFEKLSDKNIIVDLIMDEHGNYVFQKVLNYCNEEKKNEILNLIIPLFNKLKDLSFGEKIIVKLILSYPELKNKVDKEILDKIDFSNEKKNDDNNKDILSDEENEKSNDEEKNENNINNENEIQKENNNLRKGNKFHFKRGKGKYYKNKKD